MAIEATERIWHDGEWIAWKDATVHLLLHSLQFGSSMFGGIRCYSTPRGSAIFRPREHLRRLFDSCRIYRMPPAHAPEALFEGCRERRDRAQHADDAHRLGVVVQAAGAAAAAGNPAFASSRLPLTSVSRAAKRRAAALGSLVAVISPRATRGS